MSVGRGSRALGTNMDTASYVGTERPGRLIGSPTYSRTAPGCRASYGTLATLRSAAIQDTCSTERSARTSPTPSRADDTTLAPSTAGLGSTNGRYSTRENVEPLANDSSTLQPNTACQKAPSVRPSTEEVGVTSDRPVIESVCSCGYRQTPRDVGTIAPHMATHAAGSHTWWTETDSLDDDAQKKAKRR
jgi:hypothetical protein